MVPQTRHAGLVELYDGAIPPPDLSPLDPYREDGKPCLKEYTNPSFFVEEWIAEQKRYATTKNSSLLHVKTERPPL